MPVRQGSQNTIEVQYTLPPHANDEQRREWFRQCGEDVKKSKVRRWVRRGCSVSTATHRFPEFTEMDAQKAGGLGNLQKLIDVGAVAEASEEVVGLNLGEFEFEVTDKSSIIVGPCVPSDRRIRSPHEGVNAEDFDQPGEEPYEVWDEVKKRVVMREARPAVDGRAICEELEELGYLRRVKLRDAAKAALRKRIAKKASSAE